MHTTKDPQLTDAVQRMNHCCGPFARMRVETRMYAVNLLQLHNAAYEDNPQYPDVDFNRKVLQLLASSSAEFVKKERLKEYEKEKAQADSHTGRGV